ncbi:MAG: hypothetical protein K8T90_05880 [Planctomycetes bacterium]|nr:hypothetical protein [Planctomycetota bacterium]
MQCLNAEGVRYLVVGGYAVVFHAEPRFTKDLDVWVDPSPSNAVRTWRALAAFGAPLTRVTIADFSTAGNFYLIGVPPNRIDVITAIDGLVFANAWRRRVRGKYAGERMNVIAIGDLIRNKRAVGRAQDLADAKSLEAARRKGRPKRHRPAPGADSRPASA